jgi:NitT/TauT family transport system ATP-binding protein
MIELTNVFYEYERKKGASNLILNGISFALSQNEIIAIIGPSGCGKSTLLRCIGGLLQPSTGVITINSNTPAIAQKQKQIGFAFQEPFLLNWLTVEENIILGEKIGLKNSVLNKRESADYFLQLVGLKEAKQLYPFQLSGGMKQRVSFARALYTNPQLLLLDEPFSAIDILTKTKLVLELSKILVATQTPTIIVTHHIEEAVLLADRILILSKSPAIIVQEIKVAIDKPRTLNLLETLEFRSIVKACRDLLFQSVEL